MLELTNATSPTAQSELRARPAAAESRAPAKSHSRPDSLKSTSAVSRTRLAYDKELSRTFVEVVDRSSGTVVSKFPPEVLVRYVQELLKDAPGSGTGLGHLVDQQA